MTNFSKLFGKVKQQFSKYLSHKTNDLSLAQRRCVNEVFYGILESGDVTLSKISRSLNEKITIEKTIERLSMNLSKSDFSKVIEENHLNDLKPIVEQNSIIVIDDSDILKPRAKKMECLCSIRDGSTGETGKGYNLSYSCLVSEDRKQVNTLTTRVFSTLEESHESRNSEHESIWRLLLEKFGSKGVYVMDRGFGSIQNMRFFLGKADFVIRDRNRKIKVDGRKVKLIAWANSLELKNYMQVQSINKNGKKINKDVAFSVKKVEIENIELHCVVMKILGHGACVLMTNQTPKKNDLYSFGKKVINQYGCRWSVEEKIRFEKQQFNYENIRVRSLKAIRNMMSIIGLVSSFVAHLYWNEISIKIIEVAKVIKEDVRFEYYRISQGIKKLFQMRSSPVFRYQRHFTKYFPRLYQYELLEIY